MSERFVRRSNQAAVAPAKRVADARRPRLLARLATAARGVIRDVRESGEVPLPHLYWGREVEQARDARAA
jgi:hypothetical protein